MGDQQDTKLSSNGRRQVIKQVGAFVAGAAATLVARNASASICTARDSGSGGGYETTVNGSDVSVLIVLPQGDAFEFELLGGASAIGNEDGGIGAWMMNPA